MLLPQERIPLLLRKFAFSGDTLFRADESARNVFLTFDDGPIPESTPWLLETLAAHDAKATFFMVADNARRYPELHRQVMEEGHAVGNHTFHHVPPYKQTTEEFMDDVRLADSVLHSGLFRPPHGLIWRGQQAALAREGYRMVMFDLNTLDYRADRDARHVAETIRRYVRPGSIVNLHDSLKSIGKLKKALPEVLSFLKEEGYGCLPLDNAGNATSNLKR